MKFRTPSRGATTLLVGLALLAVSTLATRNLIAQRAGDDTTARLVCEMVERYHISQEDIDDDVSQVLVNSYVEDLDPQKLYFLKSDIESFHKQDAALDEQLQEGNVRFAFDTFDVYLKRLDERTAHAHHLIDQEYDFTKDESMITDVDQLDWAESENELNERWRKRIKHDILALKLEDTPIKDIRERLHKRYRNIRTMMLQTEDAEKLEIYLSALTQAFDPHSSYMSPETLEDFRIQMSLRLEGIGAALRSEDGYTIVASIVPGGAADKDGRLEVGDKIIGVAQGDNGEIEDIVEMKLSRVVRLIRGNAGTKVRLQVKKEETTEIVEYALTRQEIELTSSEVRGEIIETGERLPGGRPAKVGVINVPSFYRDFEGFQRGDADAKSTARDVEAVLKDFNAQGVDMVVVDLRTNGGGALSEAIEVSGLFIDQGPVVQVKDQNGRIKSHEDEVSGVAWAGPLVVLTNRLSASASEIFAGVIKDYQRGIIIGDKTTHGKGTVQNVMPVSRQLFQLFNAEDRGALKLTINQFYRVNGDSTQNRGVESDVVLPSLFDHMDLGESSLDNAMKFDQVPADDFSALDMVTAEIVSTLRERSAQRVGKDPEFAEVKEEIAEYLERKNRGTVSLNEATLRKERADDKEQDDPEKDKNEDDTDGPIFPVDHYNDETLRISLDYLELLGGNKTAGK